MSSSKQLEEDFSFFIHQSRDYKAENLAANLERTCSICLNLLTQLPSSRQAIFDYFNSLLDIEIHCFVEKDSVIANLTVLLTNIESKLVSLATQSSSWANILALWSIDRLFQVTQRQQSAVVVKKCESLDERIQLWNRCQATASLMKISSVCILHGSKAADTAVSKYLEASIQTQSNFDWITVALSLRCGKVFISRLVECGLSEIDQIQTTGGFTRVMKIWSSLAIVADHIPNLFVESLTEQIQSLMTNGDMQKQASISLLTRTVFLINDSSLCDLTYYSLYRSLNTTNLRRFCLSIRQTKSGQTIESLVEDFLPGLIRVQTHAFEIIQFILDLIHDGASTDQDEIEICLNHCCQFILQSLCEDCHYKFRIQKDGKPTRLPIMTALQMHFDQLLMSLNYAKNPRKHHLINDLCFNVALHNGSGAMSSYLQYIFTTSMSIDILQDIYLEFDYYHPNAIEDALNWIFEGNDQNKVDACLENLYQLLLNDEPDSSNGRSVETLVWSLIDRLSRLLSDNSNSYHLILKIITQLNHYQNQPTYEQILRLASSFTDIHMKILEENEKDLIDNLLLWRDAFMNIIRFNNPDFHLFSVVTLIDFLVPRLNTIEQTDDSWKNIRSSEKDQSLFEQNVAIENIHSNRLLSRSFKRNINNDRLIKVPAQFIDQYTILMTQIFNELIFNDLSYNDFQQKQQLFLCLATAVIDNILPDSIIDMQFDDELCKTPNERNLAIIRRIDDQPMIWIFLELIAADQNAFQLCIPIIRCVLSSLIVQWENCRGEDRAKTYIKQLNLSTNLIRLLKKARFLPAPLNEIHELFPLVTAYDCFTLLTNVWNYLKYIQQNIVAQQQQQQQTSIRDVNYIDPIRFVIQKNIADVGSISEHFLLLQNQINTNFP